MATYARDKLYSTQELKDRSWTDSMIRKLLGKPDDYRENPRYKSAAPMRFWSIDRVTQVEATPEFATAQQKSEKLIEAREEIKEDVDVLTALFTLNRRAKRCRDLSQHNEKKQIYWLKGQVLHYAHAEGRLTHAVFHKNADGLWMEVLAGEGYRFHRPCAEPNPVPADAKQIAEIEAKPKDAKEPRLVDAYAAVENYLSSRPYVPVFTWSSPQRSKVCYECGEVGHIARDCGDKELTRVEMHD